MSRFLINGYLKKLPKSYNFKFNTLLVAIMTDNTVPKSQENHKWNIKSIHRFINIRDYAKLTTLPIEECKSFNYDNT